jgi:Arc/MetJ family transcription regulator
MAIRTTIRIDEALMVRVSRLVPTRGLSRFVNDALAARVDAIEREQLTSDMIEGYIATREDREALNRDWQTVDGEGWP